ncbi:hypothetical protein BOX15_Mlig001076g2 [Macrostomum lignano]|uniref:Neuroendocrine convertase 2 n=1 Tax=Macrostomum lignano TaxID=282301 RepID=A0A267GWD6_9PLAT|nr:hypothetical protein BOX15_Mlig001076g2 [Macrostomum lignano]
MFNRAAILLGWCLLVIAAVTSSKESLFTNHFHVTLKSGNEEVAKRVARDTGLRLVRRHLGKDTEFHYVHDQVPEADSVLSRHLRSIADHEDVARVVQLEGFKRVKRGFKPAKATQSRQKRSASSDEPTDPMFKKEWYIKNTGQAGGYPGLDLNVLPAWKEGVTGNGVTTAIMDDGIDYMHPDLAHNYNMEASYDFSSNDPYPYPRYTDDWFNSHGTRCAGEISSKRDNGICGVGVAYGSKIAGLRMLDQPYMTDLIEAAAMSYKRDIIDIYSASWGPTDDGKTVDGPRNETMRAIVEGVNKGRNGKGSIFVWASGDGGPDDDCNCDGYAASMWTISINSATNDGETALYDESCSSTLASTFSNGKASTLDAGVATVDLYGKCTLHHSGTSAAAPEAAGVFALALEANSNLTWRDMQHLVVLTSKRNHLYDPNGKHDWTVNSAGLEFNHLFGYGVLDAGDIVKTARDWKTVPERFHCIAGEVKRLYHFNVQNAIEMEIDTDACKDDPKHRINYIEHVQAFITLKSTRRGDVTVFLTAPTGTTSLILSKRQKDADSKVGFTSWPFMTTHMWGESPRGKWKLKVALDATDASVHGVISEWVLVIHGTQEQPYKKLRSGLSSKIDVIKKIHEKKSYTE